MNNTPVCPSCKKPLPQNAPKGLCANCLLGAAAGMHTVSESRAVTFNPPSLPELTARFPQLEILELLGRGGMGAVYKARQKQLDRIVALKILPQTMADEPKFAARFMKEARALAKLNHPNIVVLYEFGQADGLFFFLMEYVDGTNLRQRLAEKPLPFSDAVSLVPQICDALHYAHRQGIIHRDIKPENILVDIQGRVKVADFGVAKLIGTDDERLAKTGSEPTTTLRTETGKVMGTPRYMAPEQLSTPWKLDHRADIYALGVVFYQMLTGELPGEPFEPPSKKARTDGRLDDIARCALARDPDRRYATADALKAAIQQVTIEAIDPTPKALRSIFSRASLPLILMLCFTCVVWQFGRGKEGEILLFAAGAESSASLAAPEPLPSPTFLTGPDITVRGALMEKARSISNAASGPYRERWYRWTGEGKTIKVHFNDGVSPANTDRRDDVDPELCADPTTGRTITIWQSFLWQDKELGSDWDVLFSETRRRSSTWSIAQPMHANSRDDHANDVVSSLSVNNTGKIWMAAWGRAHRHAEPERMEWDLALSRSTDGGTNWSAAIYPGATLDQLYDLVPQIRSGSHHTWLIAYGSNVESSNTDYLPGTVFVRLCRSVDDGETWSSPQTLHTILPLAGNQSASRGCIGLATDGKGRWILVIEQITSAPVPGRASVLAFISTDNGASWQSPVVVNGPVDNGLYPRIATDRRGNWVCVWTSEPSVRNVYSKIGVAHSSDNGLTWSNPFIFSGPGNWGSCSDVACDPSGTFVLIWSDGSLGDKMILHDRKLLSTYSTNAGRSWAEVQCIAQNATPGAQTRPRIAANGNGQWTAVWSWNGYGGSTSDDGDVWFARAARSPIHGITWRKVSSVQPLTPASVSIHTGSSLADLTLQTGVTNRFSDGSVRVTFQPPDPGPHNLWIRVATTSKSAHQTLSISCQ